MISSDTCETVVYPALTLLFILIWKAIFKISDNAVNVLLKFLNFVTKIFGKLNRSLSVSIPSTLSTAKRIIGINDNFDTFAVCSK